MLKVADKQKVALLILLSDTVFSSSDIYKEWDESFILNLYKGKGEALVRSNYRGIKLTNQVIKLLERMLHSFISNKVDNVELQLAFVPYTAISIVRHLQ